MDQNLARKAGKGIAWNLISQAIQQVIQIFVIVTLTRLLTPGEFGIFAMIIVFFNFAEPFRQWGFQAFLIQKNVIDDEYKDTAFWSICAIAICLFTLSIISAPLIAKFFNNPQLTMFLRVGSLGFLLSPIGSVQWALANRKMDFKMIMIRDTISAFIYGTYVCFLAFNGYGVWSLVIAFVVKELSLSIILWIIYDWRPSLRFNYSKFKDMSHFSFNCIGSGVLSFFTYNVDNIIVGRFLGATNLGLYNLAFNTVNQPETKLVSQVAAVTFPVFSAMQHENERLREAYIKVFKMLLVVLIPLLTILFMCAKDLVLVFYGQNWLLSVVPIQIMCLYGLIRGLSCIAGPIFLSKGRPDINLKINFLSLVVFVVFIFFGLRFGIIGVAVAVLLYSVTTFFPIIYFCNKLLEINSFKFCLSLLKYISLVLIMIFAVISANAGMRSIRLVHPLLHLLFNSLAGLFVYILALRLFFNSDLQAMITFIRRTVS